MLLRRAGGGGGRGLWGGGLISWIRSGEFMGNTAED